MFGQLLSHKNKMATVLYCVSGTNFGSRVGYLNKPPESTHLWLYPPPAGPAASLRPLHAYSLPLSIAAATRPLAPAIAFGRQSEAPGAWPATAVQPAVAPDAWPWSTSTEQQASDPASLSRRLLSAVCLFRFGLRCGLYACLRLWALV
jgi:hypothetical protein